MRSGACSTPQARRRQRRSPRCRAGRRGGVLGAATPVELTHLTVTTDTPGFTAKIEAGSSEQGPFTPVSGPSTVAGTTDFTLNVRSSERYYVVWITKLTGPTAHVNEVRAG